MINYLKSTPAIILYAILGQIVCYFLFGFYFERYEPIAVSFVSGFLTPGMLYDDFFYLAHLKIVKLFAFLFNAFPKIAWLSVFQYSYLVICFVILLDLIKNELKSNKLLAFVMVVVSLLFMEYYVLHVMTRVSFLLSFSALLRIIVNYEKDKKWVWSNLFYYLLFALAIMIRTEPPSIILLILGAFYFIYLNQDALVAKIKNTTLVFFIPFLMCFIGAFWVGYLIQTSDEFYILIEPEVEYELTARNNFVPLSEMQTKTDSIRYQAIYNGIWGDTKTNDPAFLRSLISKDQDNLSYLLGNTVDSIKNSAINCQPIALLNIGMFLLLLFTLKRQKVFRIFLFHLTFYAVIFLMAFKVKMVETSLSPMLFSVTLLYLYLFFKENKKKNALVLVVLLSLISLAQIQFLQANSTAKKEENFRGQKLIAAVEGNYSNKSIYIDQLGFNTIFNGFKPFEVMNIENIEGIYIFDMQHMTTVQPYKTFLSNKCSCNANDYSEYYPFIINNSEKSVFVMNEENVSFFETYLQVIHGINSQWVADGYKEKLKEQGFEVEDLGFFNVQAPN